MTKNNYLPALLLLTGLLFPACREAPLPESHRVVFSLEGTRSTETGAEEERRIERWDLLLYRDGKLTDAVRSDSGDTVTRSLQQGTYTAFAIVNPPESFRPTDYPDLGTLSLAGPDLADNGPGRFVMAGSRIVSVPVSEGEVQTIGVDRLVCKVLLRKISTAFTDPVLASRTFVLKALYLTNVCGKSAYADDLAASVVGSMEDGWYHRAGDREEPAVDELLADRGIDRVIPAGDPYTTVHAFYPFPNPLPEKADSRSEPWCARRTRLVLEAQIGGQTFYYPITLPASRRNQTVAIDEAIIRNLGSEDPEQDQPGALEIVFSTHIRDWDPLYLVEENS